jgi:hypothetical protein
MSKHDYLVLGMAAVFIVANFVGAAFTIRRVLSRSAGRSRTPAPAE